MWRAALFALVCAPLAAFADAAYDEAEVVDVEPIVAAADRVEPEPRCWSEAVDRPAPAESAAKPLLGALVGGAIGNALGHNKRNKQVGAVVGALLGGATTVRLGLTMPGRRFAARWPDGPNVGADDGSGVVRLLLHRDLRWAATRHRQPRRPAG